MAGTFPSQPEALHLHSRLLREDAAATADFAAAYLEPLAHWLGATNPGLDADLCADAAEDAVLAVMRRPQSYDPARGDLAPYLRMSARADLRNALRRGRAERGKTIPLSAVELSRDEGNYLGRDDDPSLPLQIAEQARTAGATVPESVRRGLTDAELRGLELLLAGEKDYETFAEVLGLLHLPAAEWRRRVKRFKDRMQKRLERAGGAS